jgi:PAS domain S-box-containing protein
LNDQTSGDRAQSDIFPKHWGKHVFEHSAVGIAVAELDGRFLTANSAFQRMVGYTEAELRELTALDLLEEADRPATRDLLSQLEKGAVRQYQVEDRSRRKDGSLIWVRKTLSLIPAGPRPVGYVVAIAEDITERKHAADELRKQHEILQKIFHHIPLMIDFMDADGRLSLANGEWQRILGWTLEEIQSRGIDLLAECYPDPRHRREVMNHIAAAKGKWADFKTRVRDGRTLERSGPW